MTTSAQDLARFVSALFAGKILNAASRKEMFKPYIQLHSLHLFPHGLNEPDGAEGPAVGLAYGMGWGLLTKTRFGPAFFKEGHGDGAQNYMICFERQRSCMILLTNSDNGELTFRPLLETILGDTVTPWEWEGYTAAKASP
jgi:CubicO group peptidase (beta-lactamase class C family)